MKSIRALIGVASILMSNCGPNLRESLIPKGFSSQAAFLATAPLIIVGSLTNEQQQEVGWSRPSKYSNQPIQLYRQWVNVENVLRGHLPTDRILVYFFAKKGNIGGIQPIGFPLGYRFIFYLRSEAGVWRTMCDDYEFCVDRVLTGQHMGPERDTRRPIAEAILEITYTRGEGITDGEMVDALSSPHNTGSRWVDGNEDFYAKLMQRTAVGGAPAVRAQACVELRRMGKVNGDRCGNTDIKWEKQ